MKCLTSGVMAQPLVRWSIVPSKTYVTEDYRIRSLLSITLHISRPGESVQGPVIKPD